MKVKQDANLVLSRNRSFELLNMKELINSEFNLHPKAQLQDYYKLFFQDAFGPEHIIKDKTSAEKYLRTELEGSSIFEEINYQEIGYINEFYRVNINVINKGIISFDDFLDAFIKSADMENKITDAEWLAIWEEIQKQIFLMKIPINDHRQQIDSLLELIKNKQLVSHSNVYRAAYSPHYRILNEKQFQRIKC